MNSVNDLIRKRQNPPSTRALFALLEGPLICSVCGVSSADGYVIVWPDPRTATDIPKVIAVAKCEYCWFGIPIEPVVPVGPVVNP